MTTKRHMHPMWSINKPKHPAQILPQPGSSLTLPPPKQKGWSNKEVMQGTPRACELREWEPETRGLWDCSWESKTKWGEQPGERRQKRFDLCSLAPRNLHPRDRLGWSSTPTLSLSGARSPSAFLKLSATTRTPSPPERGCVFSEGEEWQHG